MSDQVCRKRLYCEADREWKTAADIGLRCIAQRSAAGFFHSRTAKAAELSGLDVVLSVGANSVGSPCSVAKMRLWQS